eukprot:6894065-Pyramimonas_sp.AAC.1
MLHVLSRSGYANQHAQTRRQEPRGSQKRTLMFNVPEIMFSSGSRWTGRNSYADSRSSSPRDGVL